MLKPLGEHIAISMVQENKFSSGGIFLGKAPEDQPAEAIVVAVGSGRIDHKGNRIALNVQSGDRILFAKYGVNKKVVDGVEYGFLKEEAILALIVKNKFVPFGDNIVVQNIHENDVSRGGIIISTRKINGLHVWGDVVECGKGCIYTTPDKSIYFPKLLGWELQGNHMLVKEEIVLAMQDII